MTRQAKALSVVFADVSESTDLGDTVGVAAAREIVSSCLELMTEQIRQHRGSLVKAVGDEIMCSFPNAEEAVQAALGMQRAVAQGLRRLSRGKPPELGVRVGLHHGEVVVDGQQVFGDAVAIAGHVAGAARAGQILATAQTAAALSPKLRELARRVADISVKGQGGGEIPVVEIMGGGQLKLSYRGTEITLRGAGNQIVIGRGRSADMVVNDSLASREHFRIECRGGDFVVVDQSKNGTYVVTPLGASFLQNGQEVVLSGDGQITLGRELAGATEVVSYHCEL